MTWRTATPDDARGLRGLEREANVAGVAHVFPAADFPFPDEGVLARWTATLDDPSVATEVYADPEPVAFAAYDAVGRLRHLAVRPDRWGSGLGRQAVERSVAGIRASGREPTLWVLVANHRALGFYEHLGWKPTGREQAAEWPPYPTEIELHLPESAHGR